MESRAIHLRSLQFVTPIENAPVTLEDHVAAIYEELRDEVYRYLVVTGFTPEQAQDIGQESFLRLYSTLRKGQRVDNVRAWVFAVARNCAIRERTSSQPLAELDAAVEQHLTADVPTPEESLLNREKSKRLHAAWGSLSDQQRRCLYLRMEGFRYREIGEIAGIGTSTVGEFLRRGINRLRKALYD